MNAGIAYTIPIASKSAPQPDTQVTLRSHTLSGNRRPDVAQNVAHGVHQAAAFHPKRLPTNAPSALYRSPNRGFPRLRSQAGDDNAWCRTTMDAPGRRNCEANGGALKSPCFVALRFGKSPRYENAPCHRTVQPRCRDLVWMLEAGGHHNSGPYQCSCHERAREVSVVHATAGPSESGFLFCVTPPVGSQTSAR